MKYRFKNFVLDNEQRELLAQGKTVSVPPKVFSILQYLIEHRDRMVTKRELLDAFWSAHVSEAALLKAISLIRKACSDVDTADSVIKTHHGLGYRFIAPVETTEFPAEINDEPKKPAFDLFAEQRLVSVLSVRFVHADENTHSEENRAQSLESFLTRAHAIVDANQGHLLHMMVDGFTADFGLSLQYEDVARRACCCADELASTIKQASPQSSALMIVLGIDTGPIVINEETENLQWLPPNSIERGAIALSEQANPHDILISETTCSQLYDEAEVKPTSTGFLLVSPPPVRAGIPGRPHKHPSKFVGRKAELAFLSSKLGQLSRAQGQAVTLLGPAGIGKSRLVSEFLSTLDKRTVHSLTLYCLPGLINTPFAPVREMCAKLMPEKSSDLVTDDIDAMLLAELQTEHPTPNPLLKRLSEQERRQRSDLLIDRLLSKLCKQVPHVLVFEDVHWMDATSRSFLDSVIRQIGAKRLMLVLTSRPTESLPLAEAVLQLSPLSQDDCLELLRGKPEMAEIGDAAADTLIKRAAGNPFFLEELALAAHTGADPAKNLPNTVQAVVAARIAALDSESRSLLYVISVIGAGAEMSLLTYLLGTNSEGTHAGLEKLIKMGFIVEDINGISFRHALIQDSAYAMIAQADRKQLHGKIAEFLQQHSSSEMARPETLAWHYQEAGIKDQAITYWLDAGRAALHRSAHNEASTFACHGLRLVGNEIPDHQRLELDLQICLAAALTALRGFGAQQVGEGYYRAQTLNLSVGNPRAQIRILVGLWIHTWVRGRLTESLSLAQELMKLAGDADNAALYLQAHASMGQVLMHMGQLENAWHHLNAGLSFIENQPPKTLPEQSAAVACASYAAWTASLLGKSADVRAFYDTSEQLSKVFNNPFAVAIHNALCADLLMLGTDLPTCLACADRAVAVSRQHDFPFWLGTGLVIRGWALGQQGHMDAAFDAFDEGIAVFEATGAKVQLANWYGLKSETLLKAGKIKQGIAAAQHALDCAEQAEDIYFVPRIHAVAAHLHQLTGADRQADVHQAKANAMLKNLSMDASVIDLSRQIKND